MMNEEKQMGFALVLIILITALHALMYATLPFMIYAGYANIRAFIVIIPILYLMLRTRKRIMSISVPIALYCSGIALQRILN